MVGDRRFDVAGAHENGLPAIAFSTATAAGRNWKTPEPTIWPPIFTNSSSFCCRNRRNLWTTSAPTLPGHLLSIGAVFLRPDEPFVWASGIKSPIYCDNRLILTAPAVRDTVEQAIADTVRREYPEAEVLMGTATAGIAHAGHRRPPAGSADGLCPLRQ